MFTVNNCCRALSITQFRNSDVFSSNKLVALNSISTKRYKHQSSLQKSYETLGLSEDCEDEALRMAFVHLAKQYHPDSKSSVADATKFTEIEAAYRTIQRHRNTENKCDNRLPDVEEFDIRHTAPQHRHYLTYDTGIGTISERQRRHTVQRAQKASENVMEHRLRMSQATERNSLVGMDKSKARDIKTRYGIDRLVEDLIQEAMSKGEFSDLPGMGKPLKNLTSVQNPHVDFVTHKLNEILIDNGFTPEWIQLSKEIRQEVRDLEKELSIARDYLGTIPLSVEDSESWQKTLNDAQDTVKRINNKINKYNLLVPILQQQKVQINLNNISKKILAVPPTGNSKRISLKTRPSINVSSENDTLGILGLLLSSFERKKS